MIYLEFEKKDFESAVAFMSKAVSLLGGEVLRQREDIASLEKALRDAGADRPERPFYTTIAPF